MVLEIFQKNESFIIVGKLNKKIIKKYNLYSYKVILTKERYLHIENKHNLKYKQIKGIIRKILKKPNYILEDNKHLDTIILLKCIKNKRYRLVVRLSINNRKIKNSIITFMKLNERSYAQTIQNRGKIIYISGQK